MFAFVVFPDHVEVLAPDVDEHVYKAGAWGHEFRLKQGLSYSLSGVSSASQPVALDPATQVVLHGIPRVDESGSKVFCILNLPMPEQIIGLRRAKPAAGRPVFAGRDATEIKTASFPLLETFVYRIANLEDLKLGNAFEWAPEVSSEGTVNLHIWAEPEIEMDPSRSAMHPSQAFAHLISLFPGVDLHIEFGAGAVADVQTNVRGMQSWEESTLLERSQLVIPPVKTTQRSRGAEIDNCLGVFVQK